MPVGPILGDLAAVTLNLVLIVVTACVVAGLVVMTVWGFRRLLGARLARRGDEARKPPSLADSAAIAVPLAIAASVLGFIAGSSAEPALGTLLSGLVSLIGGAAAMLVARDKTNPLMVGVGIAVFALSLLSGVNLGLRTAYQEVLQRQEAQRLTEEQLFGSWTLGARLELRVNGYRRQLGLDPLPAEDFQPAR